MQRERAIEMVVGEDIPSFLLFATTILEHAQSSDIDSDETTHRLIDELENVCSRWGEHASWSSQSGEGWGVT